MLVALDYLFIGLYLLLLIFLGLHQRNTSNESFLLSERSLTTAQTTTSIFSSNIGAGVLITYTALVYLFGLGALWFFIGTVLGYFVFFFFAKKIKKLSDKKKYYTLPDFFFDSKGRSTGYLVSFLVFVSMFGWVLTNFIGGAKIVENYSSLPFTWSVGVMGSIILLYVIIGGFQSVVRTDAIQTLGIALLVVLMVFLVSTYSHTIPYQDFNLFSLPLIQLVNFFLAGILFPFASAELWQRVYAAKSQEVLKKSIVHASVLYLLTGIILLCIGLVIRNTVAGLDPDVALISGLSTLLPVGLSGLAVIVFYSAIMSSADTYLFTANASLIQNLLARWIPMRADTLVIVMRISLSVLMTIVIVGALVVEDVVDATFLFVALMMSLAVVVLAVWIRPSTNSFSLNSSIGMSFFGVIILAFVQGISINLVLTSLGLSIVGLFLGGSNVFLVNKYRQYRVLARYKD